MMDTKGLCEKVDRLKNIFPVHHQVDFIVIEVVQDCFHWINNGVVFNLTDYEFRLLGLIYLKKYEVYSYIPSNALYILIILYKVIYAVLK